MSILIAAVIGGIILVMVASVNDAMRTATSNPPTATPLPVAATPDEPAYPAPQAANQPAVAGQDSAAQRTVANPDACINGCLLDGMCGQTQSIVARFDPTTANRFYYPPEHPNYQTFRDAETLGETNYYFCNAAQAEALDWSRAP